MKGSLLWKFMYLFCVLAGILAGYGIVTLASTEDNTLVRESGDSVFFDEEVENPKQSEILVSPEQDSIKQEPAISMPPSITEVPASPTPTPLPTPVPAPQEVTVAPLPPTATVIPAATEDNTDVSEDKLPSLGRQWAGTGENVPKLPMTSVMPQVEEPPVTQTITYPAQIFGQVPVLNRSDDYVSYFEFAYDLIAMMEPVVSARGLNINVLLAQFVIKALFCGVDVEKLDINAPIPRRLAALCLWLGAQVLNESGYDTSSKSAGAYVTDISGCSASEKKAVAYLYESGILQGYQVSGQRFYPEEGLKTEAGNHWLSAVKQHWK